MAKFEQAHGHHVVHELHKPQGHGYIDQKYGKGNLSPMRSSVPQVESGSMPSMDAAGSPGMPMGEYGSSSPSGAGV